MEKRALIVGIAAVDIVIICEKYPKEDEKGKALSHYKQKGGNVANSAEVLSRLGLKTSIFCYFEKGENGQFVKNKLEDSSVDTSYCIVQDCAGFPTSYCILSQETCSRTTLHSRSKHYEPKFRDFLEKLSENLSKYSWVHFDGRGFPDTSQMIQYVHKFRLDLESETGTALPKGSKNFTISLELERVKSKDELLSDALPYADIAFISKDFAVSLGYSSAKEAVMNIKSDQNLSDDVVVIIPWGKEGADAIDGNNVWHHCDAYPPKETVDTIGAGDTFIAAIIYGLSNNRPLPDEMKFACELAGKKCGMFGFEELI